MPVPVKEIEQPGFWRGLRDTPVTVVLLAGLLMVYAFTSYQSADAIHNVSGSWLASQLWLEPARPCTALCLPRVVGAPLLAFGPLSLIFGGSALLVVGRQLEGHMGSERFLVAYLVAACGSAMAVALFEPLAVTGGPEAVVLGLSAILVIIALRARMRFRFTGLLVLLILGYFAAVFTASTSFVSFVGGCVACCLLAWPLLAWRRTARQSFVGVFLTVVGFATWLSPSLVAH